MKNNKVIKALTIGLAAAIAATSTPINVFAEDENTNIENQENSQSETSNSQGDSVSETTSECANIISEENNQITEATEAIGDASTAVGDIITAAQQQEPVVNVPTQDLLLIQNELQEGATDIANAGTDLQIAVSAFNEALVADLNVDNASDPTKSDSVVSQIAIENEKVEEFNNSNITTTQDANDAIREAGVANTSNSKSEAYAAKDKAVAELNNAEAGLKTAEAAYNLASSAVDAAQAKYDDAVKEQKKAKDKLNEAKTALNNANTNATAANEKLKAAQAKMDQLDSEVTRLAQAKDDLVALQNQYYKLMVHFYRDNKINTAVYDADGKLKLAESAALAEEKGKLTDTSVTENTMRLGRELMKDLVIYKLKSNGAENIQFAVKEDGLTKKLSADGELGKDGNGKDRVTIGATQDQYWDYQSGNSGRMHNVKVTYTIKNSDGSTSTITEYYNYIIKADKYNDTGDIDKGPIYLAQIDPEAGTVTRDLSAMDDFVKLSEEVNKAIDAAKIIDEYNDAKKAVDDAQSLVDTLNTTIKELSEKKFAIDEERMKDLEQKLKDAKEVLKKATEDKEKLEEKVEEARKAVAAINLSRFDEDSSDDSDSEISEPGSPSPAPASTEIPVIPSGIPSAISMTSTTGVVTTTGTSAGVAGARADRPEINTEDKIPEKEKEPELVKIEDNEIPLAEMPNIDDIYDYSILLWLLLILLLLILLYLLYRLIKENKKNKEKEEEKQ